MPKSVSLPSLVPDAPGVRVPTGIFVAGDWRDTGTTAPVLDKFSGETIAEVSTAGPDDVREAVVHCHRAFEAGPPPPHERAAILHKAARLLEEGRSDFETSIVAESGFSQADAAGEVSRCIQTLTVSAEEARRFEETEVIPLSGAPGQEGRTAFLLRVPIGVAAAITPFNSPLNTVAHKLAPALAAGNPVVLKASGHTPLTAALLCRLLLEAGVPDGFVGLVHGPGSKIGKALLAQPEIRFFTFTGSTEVGRAIQAEAGLRRTQLELGSIAFTALMADADLDRALPLVRNACFRKAGQVCTSIQILLAHEAIAAEVGERLVVLAEALPRGNPREPDTLVGPMITEAAAVEAKSWVDEAIGGGARLLCGGTLERALLHPTILADVPENARAVTEEIFAPVVSILPFGTLDEVVARVNATPYGLATGLLTRDIETAMNAARRLHVGGVHINNTCSSRVGLMPYGGVKDSGFGREGPRYAMREMSEERLITITTA